MKNFLYLVTITIFCISCTKEIKGNFNISGKVIGLKKGTIYLEKIELDSTRVLDSIYLDNGEETFTFSENINEADLFSISLDKSLNRRILFFGEPGDINIETELSNFFLKAKVTGSKQQDILKIHDEYTKQIQYKNLDLIKDRFIAQKNGNLERIEEITDQYNQNLKRIYLFSANYIINNGDQVIAPYIAITRMENATPKLKKQIYDALTQEVKESKYGLLLKEELDATL